MIFGFLNDLNQYFLDFNVIQSSVQSPHMAYILESSDYSTIGILLTSLSVPGCVIIIRSLFINTQSFLIDWLQFLCQIFPLLTFLSYIQIIT